jgi:hypothetical protein
LLANGVALNAFNQPAPVAYDSDRRRVMGLVDGRTKFLIRGNFQPVNFVDWRNPNPPGNGSAADPFPTVQEAIPCITDGSTLFIQSGAYQTGPITMRQRVQIVPLGGAVTIR